VKPIEEVFAIDKLTVKFKDHSQITIKTKRNIAMNYWNVDYAHKAHHIREAYIDTYPMKNHPRQWLAGGPPSGAAEEKTL